MSTTGGEGRTDGDVRPHMRRRGVRRTLSVTTVALAVLVVLVAVPFNPIAAHAAADEQPTVSSHVKRLRDAGLVSADRQGNRTELSINSSAADALAKDLNGLLTRESAS